MREVIDENVLLVANDLSRSLAEKDLRCPQADDDCQIAAVEFLRKCTEGKVVLLDDAGDVLTAYRSKMSGSGQPGSGDAFFRYISENQYNSQRIVRVELEKSDNGEFAAFPKSANLKAFDADDRIYAALALTGGHAEIVNCVDSDWSLFQTALEGVGVVVRELCPNCLKPPP
jgi:hypothetical protein